MGNAYTATLPSTAAILTAVRKAHRCQQGIRSEQSVSHVWAEALPPCGQGKGQQLEDLYLSPDARLCAVACRSVPLIPGTDRKDYTGLVSSGIVLYETHTGVMQRSLRIGDTHLLGQSMGLGFEKSYLMRWSSCSQLLTMYCGSSRGVTVYEAATGNARSEAWPPDGAHKRRTGWCPYLSPDGRYTLVCTGWSHSPANAIMRVEIRWSADATLVASFRLWFGGYDCFHATDCVAKWLWHPSSTGLVFSTCNLKMVDPKPLQAAGFSVGHCLLPAHLSQGSAFSPSRAVFLAPADVGHGQGFGRLNAFAVLRCAEACQTYSFDILHVFDITNPKPAWCFCEVQRTCSW